MRNFTISESALLAEALAALNALSGGVMTLLVVDTDSRMMGTLTDGDIRRALLAGKSLQAPVADAMHRQFRYLSAPVNPAEIRAARQLGIKLLPILDADSRIVDTIDLTRQSTRLPIRAVLMAGGRGERLRPLTDVTPKPLLPMGDSTVIDLNVNALRRCGVSEIFVTTRYLAEQIEAHFAGTEVKCVRESAPLGTLGAIALLPPEHEGITLVMNSDLITTIDFEELYLHHLAEGNDITIATISHTVSVPFAILEVEGQRVTAIEEKPLYTHYANAGIYLISNSLLSGLKAKRLDAPDFIAEQIAASRQVGHFPISGTWLDIGTPADYAQARDLLKKLSFWHRPKTQV